VKHDDICQTLTGSRRNAMMDDDRADLLWRPEKATNSTSHEGNLLPFFYHKLLLFDIINFVLHI